MWIVNNYLTAWDWRLSSTTKDIRCFTEIDFEIPFSTENSYTNLCTGYLEVYRFLEETTVSTDSKLKLFRSSQSSQPGKKKVFKTCNEHWLSRVLSDHNFSSSLISPSLYICLDHSVFLSLLPSFVLALSIQSKGTCWLSLINGVGAKVVLHIVHCLFECHVRESLHRAIMQTTFLSLIYFHWLSIKLGPALKWRRSLKLLRV